MDLEPWNPWQEFETLRAEADRRFAQFFAKMSEAGGTRPIAFFPTTDLVETEDEVLVFLSIPGAEEEDIDISLDGRTLLVRGELDSPYDAGHVQVRSGEWRYGYFERRLDLTVEVEEKGLVAEYRAGVLTIRMPKRTR